MASFLIIDDYPDAASSLAILCEALGHQALPLTSGKQAVEAALRFRPDVIVTDLNMPEVSGVDIARRIREHEALRDILLVGLSGDVPLTRGSDEAAPFDLCFAKPLDVGGIQAIAYALAR